ncbi:MAG TPA: ABC transporter permease, partial [Dongiaceae bacterium]|nr:ABC transporter permease [Dongiaceae bacterium]
PMSDFDAWRREQHSFDQFGAGYSGTVNVSGLEGPAERFQGAYVTPAMLALPRVRPLIGRLFTEDEQGPGSAHVALIGYDLWQQKFESDTAVIGKTLRANGETWEIVGVMPRGFEWPDNCRLWLPLRLDPAQSPWGSGNDLDVAGRLRPGVSPAQATQDLGATSRRLGEEHPDEDRGVVPVVEEYTKASIGKEARTMLWTMMGAVLAVLLIACTNVANLLLARAATRTREVAVRAALGAGRRRLVSYLLAESLVLAAGGAVLGIVIALLGVRWFNGALTTTQVPYWIRIRVDGPTLAFTFACTLLAAVVAGLLPAIQATGTNMNDVLKDEGRGVSSLHIGRFSKGLVVAQLALASGLLVAAGFMIQSVVQRSRFDYGVPTAGVFTGRIGLFESTYPDSASRQRFWQDVERRLRDLPGQQGVALTTVLPGLVGWTQNIGIEGTSYATDRDYPDTRRVAVSPGFFDAFHLAPVEGRVFSENDVGGSVPVAVVTRGFARRFYGGGSALGHRVRIGDSKTKEPWLTIVGVIPDVWYNGTDDQKLETVFTPLAQADYRFLSLAVRTGGDPLSLSAAVRTAVGAVDRDQPVYFVRTLDETIRENGWFYAVFGDLFAVFGVAALALAVLGVYGVMSFTVRRRTQEVGIRMALGAVDRDVLRLFLRQGLLQVGSGTLLGLALAVLLTRGMRAVMFQVTGNDPAMFIGVSAALIATGLLATLLPARRAMSVDPVVALRYE